MKKSWVIDADVFIEGERENPTFFAWAERAKDEFVTADIVRGQFLLGIHAVKDPAKKNRGLKFYAEKIAILNSISSQPDDYELAARIVGEAWRGGNGAPDLMDGLVAAIALRTGATVATRNIKDFKAMGCPCENPLD
jgi:predicted nucleic acid-binding protein